LVVGVGMALQAMLGEGLVTAVQLGVNHSKQQNM
jgi:hypothetical protein